MTLLLIGCAVGVDTAKDSDSGPACTGAEEVCNDLDDDCNGAVDDSAADATHWYADGDGDGDGDPFAAVDSCAAPVGYVATSGDCDDAEPLASSTGTEVCGDGIDNDCLTGDAECDVPWPDPPEWATGKLLPPAGLTRFGQYLLMHRAISSSAPAEIFSFTEATNSLGRVIRGADLENTRQLSPADTILHQATADSPLLGLPQLNADFDEDGIPDFVTAVQDQENTDRSFLVFAGPATGPLEISDAVAEFWTESARTPGLAVLIGDNDEDGHVELALGLHGNSYTDTSGWTVDRGKVYVLEAPATGVVDLDDVSVTFAPNAAGESKSFGDTLCSGDLDGDGLADLAIGSPAIGSGLSGSVGVLLAPFDGDREVTNGNVSDDGAQGDWAGDGVDAYTGLSLTCGHDATGDGLPDLLIGADGWSDETGQVYLVAGPATGLHEVTDAAWTLTGDGQSDVLGRSATLDTDLDGDGFGDVVVGSNGADDRGRVTVFYGGALAGEATKAEADQEWAGEADEDLACMVTGGVDLNDDGFDDLAIGAWGENSVGENAGAIYLVHGGPRL